MMRKLLFCIALFARPNGKRKWITMWQLRTLAFGYWFNNGGDTSVTFDGAREATSEAVGRLCDRGYMSKQGQRYAFEYRRCSKESAEEWYAEFAAAVIKEKTSSKRNGERAWEKLIEEANEL